MFCFLSAAVGQVCGCQRAYSLENREEACLEHIRRAVGGARVLVSHNTCGWGRGPGGWVLGPGGWVLGAGYWVLGSGSWVLGPRSPGSWVLGTGFWVLGTGSWVLGPGF